MADVLTKDDLIEELQLVRQDFKKETNSLTIKTFQYFDKQFGEINKRFDSLDEKFDRLMTTLDAFLKRLDDIEKNNVARDEQLARLQSWAKKVAAKTGVKLEY